MVRSTRSRWSEIRIRSNVDKQPGRFKGIRSTGPYEAQLVRADDSRERKFMGHLNLYFAKVIAAIRDADAVLILGPGEAKGELKKRLVRAKLGGHVAAVETTDKLTVRQIAAKARKYFHEKSPAPSRKQTAAVGRPLRRNTLSREV